MYILRMDTRRVGCRGNAYLEDEPRKDEGEERVQCIAIEDSEVH